MLHQKILDQINEQASELLNNSPFKDAKENLRAIIQAIFSKLDLVTREEFDTQQKVLAATRQKLEELENAIKKLV